MATFQAPSPTASDAYDPSSVADVAEKALRLHASATTAAKREIGPAITRIAAYAWRGEGDTEGLHDLIVESAQALYQSPADAIYERPFLDDPIGEGWVERLEKAIGSDTPLSRSLVAAGVRLELMAGKNVLPASLAVLFRADPARVHVLTRKPHPDGGMILVNAVKVPGAYQGRGGRRPLGAETRITAASAFRWLVEQGRVPEDAVGPPEPEGGGTGQKKARKGR